MKSLRTLAAVLLIIVVNFWCSVNSLKCVICSSVDGCKHPSLKECNHDTVRENSMLFAFLPTSLIQPKSEKYNCVSYKATLANNTKVQYSGCFYNTYNPCEDINQIYTQKWTCKYCDTSDGCNPASKQWASFGIVVALNAICKFV